MKKYRLGELNSRSDEIVMGVVIACAGVVLGLILGLSVVQWYILRFGSVNASQSAWCGLSDSNVCEVFYDNKDWINHTQVYTLDLNTPGLERGVVSVSPR